MNGFASWAPGALAFFISFGVAALVGSVIYWGARFKSLALQGVATLVCMAALLLVFITFAEIFKSGDGVWMLLSICVVGGFGALQASIERAIDSSRRTWKWHFGRSLLSYVVATGGTLCVLGLTISSVRLEADLDETLVSWAVGGYVVGFLFAPLSISFFRWMIPGSRLRPGIDRPLQEGDAISNRDSSF